LLVGGTFIYWHWEAMLISFLATRVITLPFTSIKELLDKSDFLIAVNPGTSYEDAFKLSTDPLWQDAWQNRIRDYLDDYNHLIDGLIQIPRDNPSIALYDNFYAISTFPEFTNCEVIATPAKYDFKPYAYGFQKNSPYLGVFNHVLKEMRETGME
jgi:hypothetical protein